MKQIRARKAAILETLGMPLVIGNLCTRTLDYGQVLVRVYASGVCGTQLREIAAKEDKYLPHLLGHEGGGIVEGIGPDVSQVAVGDHVVMHWRRGQGRESDFPIYDWDDMAFVPAKTVGGGLVTTFNEYAVVGESRLTPIDKDIPFDIAALMGCAVTTGFGVVFKEAKLMAGESIAIIGCGGVGLNVIQAASLVSANPIIAIDINNLKLQLAWKFGANYAINSRQDNFVTKIQDIIGPKGVNVIVDCTGLVGPIEEGFQLVAPGGRMVLVGLPYDEMNMIQIHNMRQHFTGKSIIFSEGGRTEPNVDIPRYLNLYKAGKLKLGEIITHRYSLDDINVALDKMRSGDCGRCVVEMP